MHFYILIFIMTIRKFLIPLINLEYIFFFYLLGFFDMCRNPIAHFMNTVRNTRMSVDTRRFVSLDLNSDSNAASREWIEYRSRLRIAASIKKKKTLCR